MKDYSILTELVPKTEEELHRAIFDKGYEQGYRDGHNDCVEIYKDVYDEAYQKGIEEGSVDAKILIENAYKKGLEDAWECSRRIMLPVSEGGMSSTEIDKVFDRYTPYGILGNLTASEAIEKIKVWEQKKEQPKCELANCICPYEIDCDECEVFCSVKRARQKAKEKE